MSANHFERHALVCGFSVERTQHDYGIDLNLYTFNARGEVDNGQVIIQLKATDHPKISLGSSHIAVRLTTAHLDHWLSEAMPVILVVYDASQDRAYWLYLQAHFEGIAGFDLKGMGKATTVRVPLANILDAEAVRQFARFRDLVMVQLGGRIRHYV
jgi:hypothetical protein